MKIGILDADHVAEELVAEHGEYSTMFQRLLAKIDHNLEFSVFKVIDGEFPTEIDGVDGFLITGSKFSAYDQDAWIDQLKTFIQKLYAAQKPLVGICFGHQIIAQALGGKTVKAEQGWGVGVHAVQFYKQPQWLNPAPKTNGFKLLVSHQDQVVELPEGAERLAGSGFCPNAMYYIPNQILTFQGHPEFSKAYSKALMDKRRAILGEATYQQGVASLSEEIDGDLVATWIIDFFQQANNAKT